MKRVIHLDPLDYGYESTRYGGDVEFNTTTGVFTGTIYSAKRGAVINDPMTCNHVLIENIDNMDVFRMNTDGTNMIANMLSGYSNRGIYIPVMEGIDNVFVYAIGYRLIDSYNTDIFNIGLNYKIYPYGVLFMGQNNTLIDYAYIEIIVF